MEKKKIPDNVVFNFEKQQYDAALKAYSTSVGAPKITISDTADWKNRGVNNLNNRVQAKYSELKNEYEKMMTQFEYNRLIYESRFSFEPIIGKTYHLYKRENGETFLSIIAPEECNFSSMGSFYLNAEQIWEKID
ncbi:DUF2452 domain-containing protein [Lutimonas zeaxanthinifaciens]|uniref:DUF2452 domain-containing protein n=1 Tax=Lutimonas zeaxanthinifaciens TaxID=3060215 RepID=UPI00265CFDE8|nr:DUF2452 domain-containing protein [Lutimonas sp. YSD2104]WKK67331.1 DUF2452 domain-containing protein [Lutimonas sp. YSD2104]